MSTEVLAAAIAIAFLAAMCMAVTGFGFALVMTPLLALIWDVKPTIASSVLLSTVALLPLLIEVRGNASMSRVSVLLVGSLAGIPPGVFLLERLDAGALQVMVAATVIVASALLYFSPNLAGGEDTVRGRLMAGFVSGSIGSSTSLSGPPIVLYLLGRESDVAAFRATLLLFFLPGNVVTILAFALVGQITGDVLVLSVAALPAIALGLMFGAWLRSHVQPERFRALVVAVLIVTSLAVLASAVGAFG
ncbi:MAG: sulfite exporter TauE/SafE family protein [Dehalococcoidia bacterium]|nr:sulfite exporter TauE/SafE family protein [Dehalococcoidia bacterium]